MIAFKLHKLFKNSIKRVFVDTFYISWLACDVCGSVESTQSIPYIIKSCILGESGAWNAKYRSVYEACIWSEKYVGDLDAGDSVMNSMKFRVTSEEYD